MKVYSDEMILIGMTYRECTPESAAEGEDSENGWVFEPELCDMDSFMGYVEEMSELDTADWFSTSWWTQSYETGTERQESLHLARNATDRMHEIWEAAREGEIELIEEWDDEWDERDIGLPVPFVHLAEFNKVQQSLNLTEQ